MEIANVLAAFAGGVGGGLYAAQVVKRKVDKLQLDFSMQDSAIRLLNQQLSSFADMIAKLAAENQHRKTQIDQNAIIVSKQLDALNNKLNSIPRRKK